MQSRPIDSFILEISRQFNFVIISFHGSLASSLARFICSSCLFSEGMQSTRVFLNSWRNMQLVLANKLTIMLFHYIRKSSYDILCAVTSHGINAGDVKKLQDAGIYTCNGLMMHTKKVRTIFTSNAIFLDLI